MEKPVEERIIDSLNILEAFLNNNNDAKKHIEDFFKLNFQEETFVPTFEGIDEMYGEDISSSLLRLFSFPNKSLEIIRNGTYEFEEFYKLLILKFKSQFIRQRQIVETGRTSVLKISEDIIQNVFNYTMQRADNTYFDFKISHENQIGVINYFINVLNAHIANSDNLELGDLRDFIIDFQELQESVDELHSNIKNKLEEMTIEEMTNGED
ncbi:hypothetical protein [Lysinibacillus sp. NPDC086135]|uniref:hypothetical protein n=1 Tax=Lysinibacillus sp. NPDC086135 TaxID=3364130 RepID=UPI00380524B2